MILRLLLLLSRPSRSGGLESTLPIVSYACASALIAIVVGGSQTFWSYSDELASTYQGFACIALVVLLLPLASLAQASARLTARRHDERLAALRLLGLDATATSRLAIAEALVPAVIGSCIGIAVSYLCAPLIGLIRFRGEMLGGGAVALPWWGGIALLLSVTGVAAASAWFSLRQVRVSPLGVAMRQNAPRLAWATGIIAVAGVVIALTLVNSIDPQHKDSAESLLAALIGFGISLLAIDLVGAWALGLHARRKARKAQSPVDLISARMVLEAPRAAWRQVSGLAMTSFVAVFAAVGCAILDASARAATNLEFSIPGEEFLAGDVLTGIVITIACSFITVACSIGVNQAAGILDRREVSRSLAIAGAPIEVQDRARSAAIMRPLLFATLGSSLLAGALLLPLLGMSLILSPLSVFAVAAAIALGIVLVRVALRATAPLLTRVAQPA